jgi:hypothetical protein
MVLVVRARGVFGVPQMTLLLLLIGNMLRLILIICGYLNSYGYLGTVGAYLLQDWHAAWSISAVIMLSFVWAGIAKDSTIKVTKLLIPGSVVCAILIFIFFIRGILRGYFVAVDAVVQYAGTFLFSLFICFVFILQFSPNYQFCGCGRILHIFSDCWNWISSAYAPGAGLSRDFESFHKRRFVQKLWFDFFLISQLVLV